MFQFGRHVEQTNVIQVCYGRGTGAKPPVAGQFLQFIEKKQTF